MKENFRISAFNAGRRVLPTGLIAAAVAVMFMGLFVVPDAGAVGKPGRAYVLDVNRGGFDKIFKIDAQTGKGNSRVPALRGTGVEPLFNAYGIAVDAQGFLIVAASDGYSATYNEPGSTVDQDCVNGCGAILRINPDTGDTVVLSQGPLTTNPLSVLLPPDNNITDSDNNYLLVADFGQSTIFKVNLNNGLGVNSDSNQTVAFKEGLVKPWDLTRQGGNVLVSNNGKLGNPFVAESFGFITRLGESSSGSLNYKGKISNSDFTHPRGMVAGGPKNFLVDPLSTDGSSDFGSLFQINKAKSSYLSAGTLFQAPSGLDFDFKGTSLLVADEGNPERENATSEMPGMIIRVSADSGGQTLLRKFKGVDPIDVAVDRRGAAEPGSVEVPPRKIRALKNFDRDEGSALKSVYYDSQRNLGRGFGLIRIVSLAPGSRIRLECLSKTCKRNLGRTNIDRKVRGDSHIFRFNYAKRDPQILTGRYRIIEYKKGKKFAGVYKQWHFVPGTARVPGGRNLPANPRAHCLKPGTFRVSPRTSIPCPK